MAALGSLVVSLEANTAKFTSAMDKAAYQTEQARRKMERDAKMIGAAVGAMAVVGVGALGAMVKSSLDAMDNMSKLAQQTGTTVESLSALSYAAGLSGVSTEALGSAMVKLSKNMSDANQGTGEAVKGFAALGISVTNTDGTLKSNDVVISELAGKFATFKDGAEKTALAVNIFGKSGAQLIPLLNSGADGIKVMTDEAARMGLVMDTEASKAAELFNDNLTRISSLATAAAQSLTVSLLPALVSLSNEFLTGMKYGNGLIDTILLLGTINPFNSMGENIKGLTKDLADLEEQRAETAQYPFLSTTAIDREIAGVKKKIDYLKDMQRQAALSGGEQSDAEARRLGLVPPSLIAAPRIRGNAKTGGTKTDPYAEAARYIEGLQKQIEKTQELTALQQLGMDINAGRVGKMTAAQQAEAIALAQKIDSIKEELDLQKQLAEVLRQTSAEQEEFFQTVMAADDAKQSRINVLLGATATGKNSATQADLVLLQTELENGRISAELYAEAVIELFDFASKETNATISLAEELGLTFTSAFEDAIVGGGKLSDVLAGLEQDIMRIVTRKLVTEPLGNALTGMLGNAIGGGLGDFDPFNLISFDGGGSTGSGSRSGGLDGKGGFMAVMHPQETVIDHTKGQSTGNTVNVTINQTFAAGTSRATTLQAAADARKQLEYAGRNL